MPAPDLNHAPLTQSEVPAHGWRQISMWCTDQNDAEHVALTRLGPALDKARPDVALWWFVRKGPSWRLRLLTGKSRSAVDAIISALHACEQVVRVTEPIYEPETVAFGGPAGMHLAHRLFAVDSRHTLSHLARISRSGGRDHRRELGLLLATRLLRAAGLDWYEQGDVWDRLTAHRAPVISPTSVNAVSSASAQLSPSTTRAVAALLTAARDSPASPLSDAPEWTAGFERAGQQLAELARSGQLQRGLRAVLAQHLLFLFNRLGVAGTEQHTLASAAAHVVFREDHHMNTVSPSVEQPANQLRAALADHIRGRGTFRTPAVEAAFRTVPRHKFLPGVGLAEAYAPQPVITKRAENGTAVSSASSPNLVADMLELLAAAPGGRVLEIGAATGINAALLAEIVGEQGQVTTIEIDRQLADDARHSLETAGYGQVRVLCGDGALGYPDGAPFDRIIITAGAWDIPAAWWDQLAPGGRLVVPVRLHGSGLTRVLPLDLAAAGTTMAARSALVCGFVPMRGADEHPEDVVRLARDVVLAVERSDRPDADALGRSLQHKPATHWTGVAVRHDEPAEHLDLWLASSVSDAHFGRIRAGHDARATGTIIPALRWAGAALYRDGTFAYLTARHRDDTTDELGITAHGQEAAAQTDLFDALLTRWARTRPAQPTITAHHSDAPVAATGHKVVRGRTRFTVTW